MAKYAEYIKQIEIDSLWGGRKHIVWDLDPKVNVLSGINGVGKSTILNKVVRSINGNGDIQNHMLKGVRLILNPGDATHIRFDIIRSLDSNISQTLSEGDAVMRETLSALAGMGGGSLLDLQLYNLQRIVDDLFEETGKKIVRTENEIRFSQIGETLLPYKLSSGEKQMLVILLTVLVEDHQNYVLFMDEPEVSLHIEWQKRLIELILELNPNVQIILTTHSPAVIMSGWMDKVTEVSDITV